MAYYTQLSYGTRNDDVKTLQEALNNTEGQYGLAPDGIYGEKTRAAVLDYQRRNSLAVDGIAGNETLGHLYSRSNTANNTAANDAPSLQIGFTKDSRQQLDNAWDKYLNREKFTYDLEADPFYQQYKKQYQNMGRLAMEDTVGRAAALSGGYNNSYAQTAGQQTYQSYLDQLNNVMPELYSAAYNRYQAEGESLYNELLLQEQRRQQAYAEQQDNYTKLANLLTMGYSPTDADLTAAGMTRAQANVIAGNVGTSGNTSSNTTKTSNTGSRSNSVNNGTLTTKQVVQLQNALGITADGLWGPNSQAEAKKKLGASNADDAWTIYQENLNGRIRGNNALADTANTRLFKSSIMSSTEFARHGNKGTVNGKTYNNYKSYVEASLADWTDNNIPYGGQKLTKQEVLFLMDSYGL